MNIKSGMTNHTKKIGESVIKKYKQNTVIKGLGKTALQRMVTEFYFSKLFSNNISVKPTKIDLEKGETTFGFYDGTPLSLLLSDSAIIPKNILEKITEILLVVSKNKLGTDKQSLKNYCETMQSFIKNSLCILEEFKISEECVSAYNTDIYNIFSEYFDQQPEVLTHGDFWLSNLLYNTRSKRLKLIDWEFADAGSLYLDLGTYYCYSLGFTNGADLFLKNVKLKNFSVQLIRYFAVYRILRILSFVGLEDVKKTKVSDEYGLAYLVSILNVLLGYTNYFKLDSGKEIKEGIDSKTKVTVFVISKNNKVLLLKRRADDNFPDMWEPPGGRKEKGETLLDAIRRELKEETGLNIETGYKYLGETNFTMDCGPEVVNSVFFTIQIEEQNIKLAEHDKYSWLTPEDAIRLVKFKFIKQLLKKIKYV